MFKLVGGVGVVELEHVLFVWVGEDRNSMWAGLRRSIETVSRRPLRMVKCLSVRLIIRNGPS